MFFSFFPAATMFVAAFHRSHWMIHFLGWRKPFLFLAVFIALMLTGPGKYSLDKSIKKSLEDLIKLIFFIVKCFRVFQVQIVFVLLIQHICNEKINLPHISFFALFFVNASKKSCTIF